MACIEEVSLARVSTDIPDKSITDEDLQLVGRDIMKALTSVGFCNLVNHGVPVDTMEKAIDVGRQYFELPFSEKYENLRDKPRKDFYGWTPVGPWWAYGDSLIEYSQFIDYKDAFNINRECADHKFPRQLPAMRENVFQMTDYYNILVRRILHALGLALNLEDPKSLLRYVQKLGTFENDTALRYTYYPKVKPEDEFPNAEFRCKVHADTTLLSFLFWNNVPSGFQVFIDNTYIDAPNVSGAILLNSGDALRHLTGGVLISAYHRVFLNQEVAKNDRYSVVYFVGSDADEIVEVFCGDKETFDSGLTCRQLEFSKPEGRYVPYFEHNQCLDSDSSSDLNQNENFDSD